MNRTLRTIAVLALATLAGCAENDVHAPPDILYGQSVCEDCGMIISDARFAAATIVLDERGRPTAWLYDDIGDQIRNERDEANLTVLARWVHDYHSTEWIRAEAARFVRSEDLHTPMASGIAAFLDVGAAAAVESELGGDLLTFEQLWSPGEK